MSHTIAAPRVIITFVCPRALARHSLTNNHEDCPFLPLHRHPRWWYVMLVLDVDRWRRNVANWSASKQGVVSHVRPLLPPLHSKPGEASGLGWYFR